MKELLKIKGQLFAIIVVFYFYIVSAYFLDMTLDTFKRMTMSSFWYLLLDKCFLFVVLLFFLLKSGALSWKWEAKWYKKLMILSLAFILQYGLEILWHKLLSQTSNQSMLNEQANKAIVEKALPLILLRVTLVGPLFEKFLFRGAFMAYYFKKSPYFLDVIFSAFVFSSLHVLPYGWNWVEFGIYLTPGFIYGFLRRYTDSVQASLYSHMIWNSFGSRRLIAYLLGM